MSILHPCLWPVLIPAFAGWVNDYLGYRPLWRVEPKIFAHTEPKYSPKLEKILDQWGERLSKIQSAKARFNIFEYEETFEFEKRGKGNFEVTLPDHLRFQKQRFVIPSSKESKRLSRKGKPFALRTFEAESWVFDSEKIVHQTGKRKSVFKKPTHADVNISLFNPFRWIKSGPNRNVFQLIFPTFVGLNTADLKKFYRWRLADETKSEYRLYATPTTRHAGFRKIQVIVSKDTFLPRAVQLVDLTGNLETVYVYQDWKTSTIAHSKK